MNLVDEASVVVVEPPVDRIAEWLATTCPKIRTSVGDRRDADDHGGQDGHHPERSDHVQRIQRGPESHEQRRDVHVARAAKHEADHGCCRQRDTGDRADHMDPSGQHDVAREVAPAKQQSREHSQDRDESPMPHTDSMPAGATAMLRMTMHLSRAAAHPSRVIRRVLLPALFAVAAVYVVSAILSFTLLPLHPLIGIGIAIDLTLTAAALFWLLAVRPGHARPAALIRVLVLGLALARLLVGISALGFVAIAIECAVAVFLISRARRLVRHVRALRREGHGLPTALDIALRTVIPMPAVASVLAMELATVVFALTGWFRSPPDGFAMHERSGVVLIAGVLAALAVVEAVAVHVVVAQFAPTLAIVLTALSAYGLLWLAGFAQSVRHTPLRFTPHGLVIERGVTRRALVPTSAIARIDVAPVVSGGTASSTIDLSYVEPNVSLELSTPVEVVGLFGRTRLATTLLLSIDDRDAFVARLAELVDHRVVDRPAQ
jgi:hypothetical protein